MVDADLFWLSSLMKSSVIYNTLHMSLHELAILTNSQMDISKSQDFLNYLVVTGSI